jgi:hypothetical protein
MSDRESFGLLSEQEHRFMIKTDCRPTSVTEWCEYDISHERYGEPVTSMSPAAALAVSGRSVTSSVSAAWLAYVGLG